MINDVNSPIYWNSSYENKRTPWDLGGPTPPFRRLLHDGTLAPGRMIVLGAGMGHDARMFARHGFAVTAVDFAPGAAQAMREQNDPAHPVKVVQSDIFDLPADWDDLFDYVLEYTCFCAIDPGRRDEYADLVTRLLRPDGLYVALSFPIGRRSGGPPFVVQPDEVVAMFAARGFTLEQREIPADSAAGRHGIEELLLLRKIYRS